MSSKLFCSPVKHILIFWGMAACGVLASLMLASGVSAEQLSQSKAVFDFYMNPNNMATDCRPNVNWSSAEPKFQYARIGEVGIEPWVFDIESESQKALIDKEKLKNALALELGRSAEIPGSEFSGLVVNREGTSAQFQLNGSPYRLDLIDYRITRVQGEDPIEQMFGISETQRFTPRYFEKEVFLAGLVKFPEKLSPDGQWLASLKDYNVWLRSTLDGRSIELTSGGTYEESWDFESGQFSPWSPNSMFFLAAQVDRTEVTRMPQVHYLKPDVEVSWFRSQKAGGVLDRSEYFMVPLQGGRPVKLKIENASNSYFRPLAWLPDSSEVLIAQFSRTFDEVKILSVNSLTKEVRLVMREASDSFVRVQHNILWGGPVGFRLLPDGKHFLWLSEREGYNQLYLFDISGRKIRQLTHDRMPVDSVLQVIDGYVYYQARGTPRPYDLQLFRVPVAGGKAEQLTEGEGQHNISMSPNGNFFADTHSTVGTPPLTDIRKVTGELITRIDRLSTTDLSTVGWQPPEEFTVKSADNNHELWGVMYKPYDFDARKNYPIIEYIYGGPQTILAPKTFCQAHGKVSMFPQALAQLGYIVVILDARGTPGRSKAFHDFASGEWSKHVIADHAAAIRQLALKHSFIDEQRVGIFGRSWGGYFSLRALLDEPELYRAAVSIAPVFDAYISILSEPYIGLPAENPQAYRDADMYRLVPKIKRPFMMAVGTNDGTFPSVMKMSAALNRVGSSYDLLVFPNQEHVIAGSDGDFMRERIVDFFEEHLAPHTLTPTARAANED
ncbi:MAG TPA: hypothetical protein DCL66_14875 [Gammaproteobacteria bacterium]|nr:hypothetical protein [Gammaproteobacteria bacterium]